MKKDLWYGFLKTILLMGRLNLVTSLSNRDDHGRQNEVQHKLPKLMLHFILPFHKKEGIKVL